MTDRHATGGAAARHRDVLIVEPDTIATFEVPRAWRPFVHRSGSDVVVSGDRTAYHHVHLYLGRTWAAISTDPGSLFRAMRKRGEALVPDPFGISSSLHNGLVPVPGSVYRDVHLLGMGDTVTLGATEGRLHADFRFEYPWLPGLSTGRAQPSTRRLLDLLTRAVTRQLDPFGHRGVLMLSSGKDSSALALAVANAGLSDVAAVTYRTGANDPEPPMAVAIAERLGIDHHIVDLPDSPDAVEKAMLQFFERAPFPGTDLSQIPYILAVSTIDDRRGAVIDGGGNDSYMGYPPKGRDLAKLRLRVRGRRLAAAIQRAVDVDSPFNYLTRSRAESILPGRTPRAHHIARLYPEAVDTRPFWYDLSARTRDLEPIDLFAVIGERYQNIHQDLMKHRLVAAAVGMGSAHPWADDEIADYYFELPERDRYDVETGKNKVLLRRMLLEHLDYDASEVGKHYFEFDSDRFLEQNREFVRSEIDACDLWHPDGKRIVHRWLDRVDRRPLLYHAILTVFMVSGWWNHCTHLAPDAGEGGDGG